MLLVIVVILVCYTSMAAKHIYSGKLNADEGFYALAAKKVMQGNVPYRDFAYSQLPVLPYVNGLVMEISGYGVVEQRTVNAVWGLLTLSVLLCVGLFTKQLWPVLWGCMLVALSPYWISYVCLGKTYAAASFFMAVTAASILLEFRFPVKIFICSLGGLLAVGCRLPVAPAVAVLWIALLFQAETNKKRILAFGWLVSFSTAMFVPFYIVSPESFIFWNVDYHMATSVVRRGWPSIYEHILLSPGCIFVLICTLVYLLRNYKNQDCHKIGVFLAAVIGILVQLCLTSSYGENATPFIALGVISSMMILYKSRWFKPTLSLALIAPVFLYWQAGLPPTDADSVSSIVETAEYVKKKVPKDGKILTSVPIIAIQAEHDVVSGNEMGQFGMTAEIEKDRAKRLGLLTYQDLITLVEHQEPEAVVLRNFRSNWNFTWSVPSLRPLPQKAVAKFWRKLLQNYLVGYQNRDNVVLLPKLHGKP